MLKSVSPPGSDRLFGCNEKSLSRNRQPPANHQALLLTYLPPVRGRYPHRPELLHTSLLSPHAQPLHHPRACFWGTAGSDTFYFVYLTLFSLHLFNLFTFLSFIFSGSQWEGRPLPASPVCSQRSHSGNTGVQLCIHSLLRLLCFTGTFRLSFYHDAAFYLNLPYRAEFTFFPGYFGCIN